MTYNDAIKNALSTVGVNYFHGEGHKQSAEYIVWQEKELDVIAEGHVLYRLEVHHYTKSEYSDIPAAIISALSAAGFSGTKSAAIEFSANTGVTHTVITCNWGANGDEFVSALVRRVPAGSDEYGAPMWTETAKTVTGIIIGLKWSELYAALSAGLKPEITVQIPAVLYDGEKVMRINGTDYQITEAKTTEGWAVEITCEDIAKAG
jgi:hypothetical protein